MMKEENFLLMLASRVLAGISLFFGFYLFFAWASFSPFDNSYSTANSFGMVENATGTLGATIMDGLYSFVGQVGNLFPFIFFFAGLLWLLYGKHLPKTFLTPLRWIVGSLLLLCGLSSIATLFPLSADLRPFYVSGGVLGGELLSFFDQLGVSNLLFYALAFLLASIGFFLCDGLVFCSLLSRIYHWIMLKSPSEEAPVPHQDNTQNRDETETFTPTMETEIHLEPAINDAPMPEQDKNFSILGAEENLPIEEDNTQIKIYGLTPPAQTVPVVQEKFIEEHRSTENKFIEEKIATPSAITAPHQTNEVVTVKINEEFHSPKTIENEVQEIPVVRMPQRKTPPRKVPHPPRSTEEIQAQLEMQQRLQAQRMMAKFARPQKDKPVIEKKAVEQKQSSRYASPPTETVAIPVVNNVPKTPKVQDVPEVRLNSVEKEEPTFTPQAETPQEKTPLKVEMPIDLWQPPEEESKKTDMEKAWKAFESEDDEVKNTEVVLSTAKDNESSTFSFNRQVNPFEKSSVGQYAAKNKVIHQTTHQPWQREEDEALNTFKEKEKQEDILTPSVQVPLYKGYGDSLIHPALQKKMDVLEKPTTPMPSIELLDKHPSEAQQITEETLMETAKKIEHLLKDFGVKATVEDVLVGPVVTRYDLALQPGVKAAKITSIESDLARALLFPAIRVAEVIPGKPYVGIETPNQHRQTVFLRDVLDSDAFMNANSPLSMALGKDISGEPVVVDLASMPHLLVAGATGAGKSVGVNTMILSLLFRVKPEEVKFIMIDPKVVELSVYNGIPHLLTEVVTDMKKAANALRWCVDEMERRYQLLAALSVRNIEGYNEQIKKYNDLGMPIPNPLWKPGDTMDTLPPPLEELPYIVVIVDEFADLMMMVGKQVEELIARLAQKARAIGIHLILATQRPSVDVITGLIKANVPTRIAFSVASKIDSRTILDQGGAEALLGRGDMLYAGKNALELTRVHGAFMTDEEVVRVANDWRARGKPNYIDGILDYADDEENASSGGDYNDDELDELFDEVADFVISTGTTSVSALQRRFRIGFNRAARMMDQLEDQGIVSAMQNGKREILSRTMDY